MVESLDMCSTMLHQMLGVFTASLQKCKVDLEQKTRCGRSPQREQALFKLPKLSSTGTAKSLCGIENHCKKCLISALCCSFIAEEEVDHSRGTSRCVLGLPSGQPLFPLKIFLWSGFSAMEPVAFPSLWCRPPRFVSLDAGGYYAAHQTRPASKTF
ncbi:uncharacterized protein LOC142775061 [Rhipicephalus microplus]|uniref:uncharacterized protein LOC142775061 n=1 Tax=Rhipicephalus microplus TaxID=6941 RepID=UPI003F6ACDCD